MTTDNEFKFCIAFAVVLLLASIICYHFVGI
nr:MAG TPA: hypothetical protein [Podoviridae sp. ctY3D12]